MFEIIEKMIKALEATLEKAASKATQEQQKCNDSIEELYARIQDMEEQRADHKAKQAKAEKMLGRVRALTAE